MGDLLNYLNTKKNTPTATSTPQPTPLVKQGILRPTAIAGGLAARGVADEMTAGTLYGLSSMGALGVGNRLKNITRPTTLKQDFSKIVQDWQEGKVKGVNGWQRFINALGNSIEPTMKIAEKINPALSLVNEQADRVILIGLTEKAKENNMTPDEYADKVIDAMMQGVNKTYEGYLTRRENRYEQAAQMGDTALTAVNLSSVIGRMLPAVVVGLLTKSPVAAKTIMSAGAGGEKGMQAYQETGDIERSFKAGTMQAAGEYAVESLLPGMPGLGKGVVNTGVKKALSQNTTKALNNFWKTKGGKVVNQVLLTGGEGAEELFMEYFEPYIDRTYSPNAANKTKEELWEAFKLGGLASLILRGGVSGVGAVGKSAKNLAIKAGDRVIDKEINKFAKENPQEFEKTMAEFEVDKQKVSDFHAWYKNEGYEAAFGEINETNADDIAAFYKSETGVDVSTELAKPLAAKTSQMHLTGWPTKEMKPSERVREVLKLAEQTVTDSAVSVMKLGVVLKRPQLYATLNNARQSSAKASYAIGEEGSLSGKVRGGLYSFSDPTKKLSEPVRVIFDGIRKMGDKNYQLLQDYARHKDNLTQGTMFGKPGDETYVSKEKSAAIIKVYEESHPEFKEFLEGIRNYYDAFLRMRVEAGVITPAQAKSYKRSNPDYVSAQRYINDQLKIGDKKHRKGGNQMFLDLENIMARQTEKWMQEIGINAFKQELVKTALENPDNPEVLQHIKIQRVNDVPTEILEQQIESTEPIFDEDGNLIPPDPIGANPDRTIPIIYNGKVYTVELSGDMLLALHSLTHNPNKRIFKPIAKGMTGFKKLITTYSPVFAVRNHLRDLQDALLYSKDWKKFIKNYPRAWNGAMQGKGFNVKLPDGSTISTTELYEIFRSMGAYGTGFFTSSKDINVRKKPLGKKILFAPAYAIEIANETLEMVPRFSEFISTIEKGGLGRENIIQAMYNAAEITVNFGRSSELGKALNKYVSPFLNPAIQGMSRPMRRIAEAKVTGDTTKETVRLTIKASLNLFTKAAMLGVAPRILGEIMYGGLFGFREPDREWEEKPDWEKNSNYMIKLGPNNWLKIPRGRVLSVITSAFGNVLKGKDADWGETWKTFQTNVAPASPFENNLVSMVTRQQLFDPQAPGRTWYGDDIDTMSDISNKRPGERFDSSTDKLSVFLGSQLGLSPKKINDILKSTTGAIGQGLLPPLTPEPKPDMFSKAFTSDSVFNNRLGGEFYDALRQYSWDKNSGDLPAEERAAKDLTYKYINKHAREISEINKEIEEISMSDATRKSKLEQIKPLKEKVNQIMRDTLAGIEEYEKSVPAYVLSNPDKAKRETDRAVFGAKYALENYDEKIYEKAQAAYSNGVSYDDYYDIYFTMLSINTPGGKENTEINNKVDTLLSMPISPEAKLYYIDNILDTSDSRKWVKYAKDKLKTSGTLTLTAPTLKPPS